MALMRENTAEGDFENTRYSEHDRSFSEALQGSRDEQIKMFALIETALKSKTGRDMLQGALQTGYVFSFEEGLDANSQSGACDSGLKTIFINPKCSVQAQLSTLVHEACHALQAERSVKYPSLLCVADQMKYHRAIEADACAHECAFIYEIKDEHPEVRESALSRGMPMYETFERVLSETDDSVLAMGEAFKSWYDYPPYQKAYDKWHKEDVRIIAEHGLKKDYNGYFMKQMPSEDVVKICLYDGKSYISPDFLETPRAFSIPDADKKEILEITSRYALLIGRLSCDIYLSKMFSREDPTGENKRREETALRHETAEKKDETSVSPKTEPQPAPSSENGKKRKDQSFWNKVRGKMIRFGGR